MFRYLFLAVSAQALLWLLGFHQQVFAKTPSKAKLETAAKDISNLLLYMMSPHQATREEREKVLVSLRALKRSSHAIDSIMSQRSREPLLRYISLEPSVQWAQIESIYLHGNYDHARYLLRHLVQTCVACHASTPRKTSLSMPFPKASPVLNDTERSEYLSILRRSREATLGYEEVLSLKSVRDNQPEVWESALAHMLALTIRVRNDPHITLELVSKLSEIGGYTPEQKEMLLAWRQAAKSWTREVKKKNRSSGELKVKLLQLVSEGERASRVAAKHGYVDYLRALNLVDEIAAKGEGDKTMAFRTGGETSEKLQASFYWIYPEVYYEACIRSLPNSTESNKCWQNFEAYRARERYSLWDREMAGALKDLAR